MDGEVVLWISLCAGSLAACVVMICCEARRIKQSNKPSREELEAFMERSERGIEKRAAKTKSGKPSMPLADKPSTQSAHVYVQVDSGADSKSPPTPAKKLGTPSLLERLGLYRPQAQPSSPEKVPLSELSQAPQNN